eukprot:11197996-Prorocentrum_lima.AAC.1
MLPGGGLCQRLVVVAVRRLNSESLPDSSSARRSGAEAASLHADMGMCRLEPPPSDGSRRVWAG